MQEKSSSSSSSSSSDSSKKSNPKRKPPPPSYQQQQDSITEVMMKHPERFLNTSLLEQRISRRSTTTLERHLSTYPASLKSPPPPSRPTSPVRLPHHRPSQVSSSLSVVSSSTKIELSPGVFVPVLSSEECWNAIERGQCVNAECCVCNALLQCKDDASHFICPDCMTVSPLQETQWQTVLCIALALKTEVLVESLLGHSTDHMIV